MDRDDVRRRQEQTGASSRLTAADWANAVRALTALGLIAALAVIWLLLHNDLGTNPDASALQVLQLYAVALFRAVVAIGVAGALALLTRAFDA
jgi:hypothetical protein